MDTKNYSMRDFDFMQIVAYREQLVSLRAELLELASKGKGREEESYQKKHEIFKHMVKVLKKMEEQYSLACKISIPKDRPIFSFEHEDLEK